MLRRRDRRHRVFGSLALHEVEVCRVGVVVQLLRLPGTQPLDQVPVPQTRLRFSQLLGEPRRVAREIERFRRHDRGRLMVLVILADDDIGEHRDDHLGTRHPDEAHRLRERAAVIRARERAQHVVDVLPRRIGHAQEPHARDADRRQRLPRLQLPDLAERTSLLEADEIPARVAARREHDDHAAMLVEHRARQVAGDRRFVIRMWRDDEDVGLEPLVRRRTCRRRTCRRLLRAADAYGRHGRKPRERDGDLSHRPSSVRVRSSSSAALLVPGYLRERPTDQLRRALCALRRGSAVVQRGFYRSFGVHA